ncbi:hypothetical protein [Mucilaginibacter sp.]|uniref:hypothetical protein n=1 Tax=Mucilaginibacter sp. TaxID=1882438 RepID=UPI0026337ED4|nr:hypothetical protein [Mucilaginibacter sp.]MDB5128946.1 hypothetical protein [Mucilaginibacter sp.]
MKRIGYLLLLLCIFLSCKSKTGDNDQDTTANGKPLDQTQALLQQFKPLINGVWIKKDYIKKVKKSKSPLAAVDKGKGITVMYIDTAQLKGDSIMVPIILNNHEGSTVALRFQSGKNTTTIELGDDELSYKVKNDDTTLIIYNYNSQTKETITTQYIRALQPKPADGLASGMNYMINHAILSGKYEGTDAMGKKINAVFTDDGKVSGLAGLTTYYVQNDLIVAPERSGHDQIIFNLNTKDQKVYSFIINKRTINLYNDAEQIKSNKPSYTLKKKRE